MLRLTCIREIELTLREYKLVLSTGNFSIVIYGISSLSKNLLSRHYSSVESICIYIYIDKGETAAHTDVGRRAALHRRGLIMQCLSTATRGTLCYD